MEDEGEGNRNGQGNSVLFDADLIPVKEHRGGSRTGQGSLRAPFRSDRVLTDSAGTVSKDCQLVESLLLGKTARLTHDAQSLSGAVQEDGNNRNNSDPEVLGLLVSCSLAAQWLILFFLAALGLSCSTWDL